MLIKQASLDISLCDCKADSAMAIFWPILSVHEHGGVEEWAKMEEIKAKIAKPLHKESW